LSLICQPTSEDIKQHRKEGRKERSEYERRQADHKLEGSRRDQEEAGGAGPSSSPRRDHEQGGGAGLGKLDFFRFELFLNSSATDLVHVTLPSTAVETAIAQCTSRWAMARGHRINTSIVLAAVHGLSSLFRAVFAVEPSLSRPLSPLFPSLISNLASVDVKRHGHKLFGWVNVCRCLATLPSPVLL